MASARVVVASCTAAMMVVALLFIIQDQAPTALLSTNSAFTDSSRQLAELDAVPAAAPTAAASNTAATIAPAVSLPSTASLPSTSPTSSPAEAATAPSTSQPFSMQNMLEDERKLDNQIAADDGGDASGSSSASSSDDGAGTSSSSSSSNSNVDGDASSSFQSRDITQQPLFSGDVNTDSNNAPQQQGRPRSRPPPPQQQREVVSSARDVVNAIQNDDHKSFRASEQPAVGDNESPYSALGTGANHALRKDVKEIEQETDAVPNEAWQEQLCTTEEAQVSLAVRRLSVKQRDLELAFSQLKQAADEKSRLLALLARTEDEHKTAKQEVEEAVRSALRLREVYLAAIAKTNAAKVNLVRERAGDESMSEPRVERDVAVAAETEARARRVYRAAVHSRLFSEDAERKAAAKVSEDRTQMDRATQIMQRADAARLDAIAEVDAADVTLQRSRLQLFSCYTKLREAADTVAAIRGESLAKAAMSDVSYAAHVHGGGQ